MLRAGDTKFFMKKEEEKRQTLNRDIKDFWAIGVATGVAGSAMDTPNEKQVNPESKDYAKYVKAQADKAEKALNNLFGNGGKATGFMAIDISFIGLSSAAMRLELNAPQILQRWMIAHSPFFLTQTAIGSMLPPQSAARSPGSLSRC